MAYTYAGQFGPEAVIATVSGATVVVPNATVTVYETDGTTKSTLYTDRTKATTAANPTATDSAGNLTFYTNPGLHVVTIVGDGVTKTVTLSVASDVSEPASDLPFLNVRDYGAVGDGVTDNLGAINAAVAALGSTGGEVRYPPGNYAVSGTVLTNQDNVHHVGAGIGATKITTSSATLPIFDFGDNVTLRTFLTVRDMMLATSVTRTAAGFIRARLTADLKVERCRLDGGYIGIDLFNTQMTRLTDLHIINCAPSTGMAVQADGNGSNLFITRVLTDAPNGSQPARGLSVKQWDGVFCTDSQFNHAGTGCVLEPATTTTMQHFWAVDCSFDTCSNAGFLANNGLGTVRRVWLENCWFGSNTINGVNLSGGVLGVDLVSPKIVNNGQHGLSLSGSTSSDITVVSPRISGNSAAASNTYDGVFIAANLNRVKITGGDSRPFAGFTNTQRRGITISAGTGDYLTLQDFNCDGNNDATGISNGATGTNNRIVRCAPFNPQGHAVTQPAVPATTVAATNTTAVDCTVWVNGGTVTVVAIGGTATGATTGAFRVPAGQTITLTYTVVPTWQWFGD